MGYSGRTDLVQKNALPGYVADFFFITKLCQEYDILKNKTVEPLVYGVLRT